MPFLVFSEFSLLYSLLHACARLPLSWGVHSQHAEAYTHTPMYAHTQSTNDPRSGISHTGNASKYKESVHIYLLHAWARLPLSWGVHCQHDEAYTHTSMYAHT